MLKMLSHVTSARLVSSSNRATTIEVLGRMLLLADSNFITKDLSLFQTKGDQPRMVVITQKEATRSHLGAFPRCRGSYRSASAVTELGYAVFER